ncbi:DUF4351 domain-containing protein [Desulfurispirillum indicum]|uniref:DUF4351 domain-containing protein n=1 Tax=Desulfurispirillum indicum TaxID=936456 RepID=UPI0022B2D7CD|nr:DUF4351 domain-containing protein [Desulfurispirillum indicum]
MTTITKEWEARGVQRGRQEGRTELLYALIERRFGSVPPEVHDRITQATEEELSHYAINVLDAGSAHEVVEIR